MTDGTYEVLKTRLVTDEMVEIGCRGVWPEHWPNVPNPEGLRRTVRDALVAVFAAPLQQSDPFSERLCKGGVPPGDRDKLAGHS